MVLDNVDEYLRGVNYDRQISEQEIKKFFNTLRSTSVNVSNMLLLLSCTTDAYNDLKEIQSDATYSSRITFHNKSLKPLNLTNAFLLISKYLEYWSLEYGVMPPVDRNSILRLSDKKELNIYPFTIESIKAIHSVGNQYARSIKTICNECIKYMKHDENFRIVQGKYLINMLEAANISRPSLVPNDRIQRIKSEMPDYMKDDNALKISNLMKSHRYKYEVITRAAVKKAFDSYCEHLGLNVEASVSSINRVNNPAYQTDANLLSIITYDKETTSSRILLKYLISENRPIENLYDRYIERQDVLDCVSYLQSDYADYGIIIRLWSGAARPPLMQYKSVRDNLDLTIIDFSIDYWIEQIMFLMNDVTDVESRIELVNHLERHGVKFLSRIESFSSRSKVPIRSHEDTLKDIRRRAAEF
jgi:hypothetical protein